jgi:hypothetical protein
VGVGVGAGAGVGVGAGVEPGAGVGVGDVTAADETNATYWAAVIGVLAAPTNVVEEQKSRDSNRSADTPPDPLSLRCRITLLIGTSAREA